MNSSRPSGPSAPSTIRVFGEPFGGGSTLPYSSRRTWTVVGTCDHTPVGSRFASVAYGNCSNPLCPTSALTTGPPANDASRTNVKTARAATAARSAKKRPSVSLHAALGAARGTSSSTAVTVVTIDGTSRCDHRYVAKLDAKARAKLPDSAFAYVDSTGQRRLPINDAPHVRNALARFNQVVFEDEAARDRARLRLLRAAQKHGVAPIGFISAQLQPQRRLPKGHVTFLLTDIERSTELLARLDDRYASLVSSVRQIMRRVVRQSGGHEVDARGDEFFAVFGDASAALVAAVAVQQEMAAGPWPDDVDVAFVRESTAAAPR